MLVARLKSPPDWTAEVWRTRDGYEVRFDQSYTKFAKLDEAIAGALACVESKDHPVVIEWAAAPGSV